MGRRGRKKMVMYRSVAQRRMFIHLTQNKFFYRHTHRTGVKMDEVDHIEEFNVNVNEYYTRLPSLFPSEQHLLLLVAKA